MRIPEEITKEHIKQAIALIDNEQSIPPHRASTGYDLRFNGKKYPPKYVLSRAYRLIHSDAMKLRNFRGGHRTNSFLASLDSYRFIRKQGYFNICHAAWSC